MFIEQVARRCVRCVGVICADAPGRASHNAPKSMSRPNSISSSGGQQFKADRELEAFFPHSEFIIVFASVWLSATHHRIFSCSSNYSFYEALKIRLFSVYYGAKIQGFAAIRTQTNYNYVSKILKAQYPSTRIIN